MLHVICRLGAGRIEYIPPMLIVITRSADINSAQNLAFNPEWLSLTMDKK